MFLWFNNWWDVGSAATDDAPNLTMYFMRMQYYIPTIENNQNNDIIFYMIIFLLSCVIGYFIVQQVNHALHSPLIAITNAISSVVITSAITLTASNEIVTLIFSFLAIFLLSINACGGFLIVHRMLSFFRKNINDKVYQQS